MSDWIGSGSSAPVAPSTSNLTHTIWDNIVSYVSAVMAKEGASPNTTLYRMLANACLREISELTLLYEREWTNAVGGDLSIVNNAVNLPIDCILVRRVEWDGTDNPLTFMSMNAMEVDLNGWRDTTGDPGSYTTDGRVIYLSSTPSDTTGKLVIRGKAYLPEFTETGSINPLEYIPIGSQLAIGDYIISRLPVGPVMPINETPAAIMAANAEVARRQNVRAEHKGQYDLMIQRAIANVNRRTRKAFSY